jgi:hypothetical protein
MKPNYDTRPFLTKYGVFLVVMSLFGVLFTAGALFLSC